MMVSELYRRQKELIQIITEKDKEIENYKAQGCKLTKSEHSFFFHYIGHTLMDLVIIIKDNTSLEIVPGLTNKTTTFWQNATLFINIVSF